MNNQDEREFDEWFTSQDLGSLEDVREYVELHARQNAGDVEESEQLAVVKSTVEYYVDCSPETFDFYR